MQKKFSILFLSLFILFSIFTGNVFALKSPGIMEVSISEWFSYSDSTWQISGPFNGGTFVSKLDFDNSNSYITSVSGEIKPLSVASADFTYGSGSLDSG